MKNHLHTKLGIRSIRKFGWLLLMLGVLLGNPEKAQATHFRYGTLTWTKVNNSTNQVQFKISQAWRRSFWSPAPTVGQVRNVGSLVTGISSVPINLVVTSVNIAEDWFFGEALITVTYPTPPVGETRNYLAYFQGCCRVSTLANNRDRSYRTETIVNIGNTNNPPSSNLPPIINLQTGLAPATFMIPGVDPDNDALTYRLATSTEISQSGTSSSQLSSNPTGFSINATTGEASFNTVGKAIGSLHNVAVAILDGKTKIIVDVMIRIVKQSNPPVFDYTVTPLNNSLIKVTPGDTVRFKVKASDVDSGATVGISAVGKPAAAVFNSGSASNPKTVDFFWVPGTSNFGTSTIVFTAEDNDALQTLTSVSILVSMNPRFVKPPTPATDDHIVVEPGDTVSFVVRADDPDPTDEVSINKIEGSNNAMARVPLSNAIYSGAGMSPFPTTAANPTNGTFTWIPAGNAWGYRHLYFTAEDKYANKSEHEVIVLVNTLPKFVSTPVEEVYPGETYTYDIEVVDPDTAYGDMIRIYAALRPSWMSFTDNGDGTATLSGTPTAADVGMTHFDIEAEDIHHHSNGHVHQHLHFEVKPCRLQASYTSEDPLCNGNSNGSIDVQVSGNAGDVTYTWSNAATTEDLSGLLAGTYSVSLVDAAGCRAEINNIVLTDPALLTASLTVSSDYNGAEVSCNGAEDASIDLTATGGTGNLSYAWSNAATTEDLDGVGAGTYAVTVSDENGCTAEDEIIVTEPTALTFDANQTTTGCGGSDDAEVVLTAGGGTGNLSYGKDGSYGSATSYSGLSAGSYVFSVKDINGCAASETLEVVEYENPTANAGADQTVYYGYSPAASATLSGSASGGTSPYSYSWSNSASTSSITVSPSSSTTYTLTVSDDNGCTGSDDARVSVIDVRCGKKLDKVTICHTQSSKTQELCVDDNAVATHLGHGDYLGPCRTRTQAEMLEYSETAELEAHPNPFGQSTQIGFHVPRDGHARIALYSLDGRLVKDLFNQPVVAGNHYDLQIKASDMPTPGVYMLRLDSREASAVLRLVYQR